MSDTTVPNRGIGDEQSVRVENREGAAEKHSDHNRNRNSRSAEGLALLSHQRPLSATSHGFPVTERDKYRGTLISTAKTRELGSN